MKCKKLLVQFVATVCMLSCFAYWGGGIAPSEAFQIGGKSLGSISDIVRTATGSDFPEIPKHSLLIYERHGNGSGMRYKSNILTINPDGSLRKRFGDLGIRDVGYKAVKPTTGIIERMDVAVSPKPFGIRRNVVYATSGLDTNPDGIYGYQTLNSVGTEDSANITSPSNDWWWKINRQLWGVAALQVKGFENKDVVVLAHTTKMGTTGSLWFKFFTLDRNETGSVSRSELIPDGGDSGDGFRVWGYGHGVRGCEIAAGDIDGDGYKNEIALTWTQNDGSWMYVYKVTKSGSNVKVTKLREQLIHDGYGGGSMGYEQACPNVVVGDFDGDGVDEAAFVGRVFPWNSRASVEFNNMRVGIVDYNGGSWRYDSESFSTAPGWSMSDEGAHAPCHATRCDFDGDGKDEIAILFFPENSAGITHPRLERWYCDHGSITPKRDTAHRKGGPGDTSVFGYAVPHNNDYYIIVEEFSITAGPLTGTKGKAKLAEDVAISHINDSRSSVYIFPTKLDSNKNFAGFGDRKLVWDHGSSEGRRGAIITGDFANEALMLDDPIHTYDDEDQSYVTILQAMPYHVDNVDINGNLVPYMINYTCSAFKGDVDTNGEMSVSYTRVDKEKTQSDITFNMASTTETIALLGDAGPYVHDYLKFKTMGANIAGNFDERAKAAADTMNTIMDFVTDKIDETTTNSTTQADSKATTQIDEALIWDKVVAYSSGQHIWRYKILNNPLPSWYKLGLRADNRSKDLKAESEERYLTFSIYDSPKMTDTDSGSTNTYQPRHEEGNFFSYPSGVEGIDGYTKNGALANEKWIGWSKGSSTGTTIEFSKANVASNSYEDKIQESELNKTVSAIASLFGADDPNPLPPYTGHSETFTKSLETAEAISIKLYGKSTIPGEEAGHRIMTMPFVAREGTLKVGHAVELLQNAQSRLWASGGRYKTYADPSLVLPHKFTRSGSNLVADKNNFSAMQMRGLRFYVPDTDQYSDTHLVAGLTYEIRVPIYNASFVTAHNVKVKLSYIKNTDFKGLRFNETVDQLKTTMNSLKEIGTETVATLGGWPDNKKWVTFKWTVPQDAANAEYVLFAQIDPANELKDEVHESRLNYSTGDIVDVGGNNEGYFVFNITSMAEARRKHAKAAAIMAGELKPGHSDGVVYGAFYQKGVGAIGGNVTAASNTLDRTGSISADVKLVGLEESGAPIDTLDFLMVLGVLSEMADVSEDAIAQMEFSVTYDGDEYYPEVYLQGVNFKEGVRDQVEERGYPVRDEIESMFAVHRMALVPHTTTHFTMTLTPRTIGFKNGAGFEFYVPEIAAASVLEEIAESTAEAETTSEEPSGEDPSSEDPGTETPTTSTLGSSGGGCDALSGSFVLLGFAVMAFLTQKKH